MAASKASGIWRHVVGPILLALFMFHPPSPFAPPRNVEAWEPGMAAIVFVLSFSTALLRLALFGYALLNLLTTPRLGAPEAARAWGNLSERPPSRAACYGFRFLAVAWFVFAVVADITLSRSGAASTYSIILSNFVDDQSAALLASVVNQYSVAALALWLIGSRFQTSPDLPRTDDALAKSSRPNTGG